jgi:predicted nucleic-acid-binding protein
MKAIVQDRYGSADVLAEALLQLSDAARLSLDDRDIVRDAAQRYQVGPGAFADYVIGLRSRAAGCETTPNVRPRPQARRAVHTALSESQQLRGQVTFGPSGCP